MLPVVSVAIHSSQFPSRVNRVLLDSLRLRQINHKFHYQSYKQTSKWLALHEQYSPARTDPGCAAIYDESFIATTALSPRGSIHVLGLGCGGGQKDARLLQMLKSKNKDLFYTPVDVGVGMVIVAAEAVAQVIPAERCFPFVCDLAEATDLPQCIGTAGRADSRLVTFFGMLPNFEPDSILRHLSSLLKPNDRLLVSANLAPGSDYQNGVERVLPLYDNALTRDWLMTFLYDLGVEQGDGELAFRIEDCAGLKRIVADFRFARTRSLEVEGEPFEFLAGERVRLFFSYRHTPALLRSQLQAHGVEVLEQWIAVSEEEGVFLCRKRP